MHQFRFQSLVAALSILLTAPGCRSRELTPEAALHDLRSHVHHQVVDESRSVSILAAIDRLDAELVTRVEQVKARRASFQDLHRNYDATDEQLKREVDAALTERKTFRKKLLDHHFEVRSLATEDEWPSINRMQSALIAARLQNLMETI